MQLVDGNLEQGNKKKEKGDINCWGLLFWFLFSTALELSCGVSLVSHLP